MASKNLVLKDATWNGVESVDFQVSGGGTARYIETSDATAVAADIAQNKTAYVNGSLITGTATPSVPNIQALSVTQNGTYTASGDVDGYSPVTVNVSGGSASLKMGVLRPDADLVQRWTYDKYIVQDEGVTLPSYTTTIQTLKASQQITNGIATDFVNYSYIILLRALVIPVYSINTVDKGREEYALYSRTDEVMASTLTFNGTPIARITNFSPAYSQRIVYWSSSSNINYVNSSSGANVAAPTNTAISNNNLTIYSPNLRLQGSTNYLAQTFFDSLEDIRYQYIVELYRAPNSNLNIDGFNIVSQTNHIASCMETASHTLT